MLCYNAQDHSSSAGEGDDVADLAVAVERIAIYDTEDSMFDATGIDMVHRASVRAFYEFNPVVVALDAPVAPAAAAAAPRAPVHVVYVAEAGKRYHITSVCGSTDLSPVLFDSLKPRQKKLCSHCRTLKAKEDAAAPRRR
jgi:hypothetical protein